MAASKFKFSGPLVLLTDFGLDDPYVGVMHGVLCRLAPNVRVIDLCHGVAPQDVRVAALFLAKSRAHFPPGSIFVAVVDPGVGSARRILAACDGGQLILAPDNGLCTPALGAAAEVRDVEHTRLLPPAASATFHGRDLFCPLAARIATGELPFEELGPAIDDWTPLSLPVASREAQRVRGEVLFADRFGNLITNVSPEDLAGAASLWRARAAGHTLKWIHTYSEARGSEASILVNSYGLLEIAVAQGNAERSLGLGPGAVVEFEK